ncbi:hypothetical protein ACHAXS_005637 [Conticribra weissflogii]
MAAEDVEETTTEKMAKAAELLQKIASPMMSFIFESIPIVINVAQSSYNFYQRLPTNYIHFLIGTIMCFFGGIYPTVFAAIEAAEHGGLTTVRKALKDISQEALVIVEESKKDDAADEDNDGVSDVKQISGKALVKRKLKLVLTKMDPNKVNAAIQSIYKVWMSVLAVLTIKFARTIALALSINHTDTVVDEITSYFFAGLGFYFQIYVGFRAPFPLNIILYPVQMMEYYIRYAVTNK